MQFLKNYKQIILSSGSSGVSIKLVCPTRWTVRADSLHSIFENYTALFSTWEEAIDAAKDTESKARIQGVSSQMNTFNFLFGTFLAEMVLRHTTSAKLYKIKYVLLQKAKQLLIW